jgi:ABC transporter substrate binding protein
LPFAPGIRKQAGELVASAPDVILANGSVAVGPLLEVTRKVPIVFVIVPDPVGGGFVDNLAHPGSNATGFLQFEYGLSGKWLELLKQIAPAVTRAAIMRDPTSPTGTGQFGAIQSVAPALGVDVNPLGMSDAREIERRRGRRRRQRHAPNGGLIVTGSALAQLSPRSHHHAGGPAQTATRVHHASRRRGNRLAACRRCAAASDDAADRRDEGDLTADRGGAREAYRPGGPKASVSIKR